MRQKINLHDKTSDILLKMSVDSPEFLEILEKVPKWHMLTPGKDKWRENDKVPGAANIILAVCDEDIGSVSDCWSMREIPENVRRSMAWFALFHQLCAGAEQSFLGIMSDWWTYTNRADRLLSFHPDWIEVLGGVDTIDTNLQDGPGAYMKWVLTQGESHADTKTGV